MKNSKNICESFLFIFILTFIGGYMNAYTFILHDGYLSTMNTGNMARIGIAISNNDLSQTGPYFMSIIANALGAMTTFICREKVAEGIQSKWQKKCLVAELLVFIAIGLLPTAVPHFIINFIISFIAGFQLASFTIWEGNLVATTIASGNIRFVGEHLGNAIIKPNKGNFLKFFMFLIITLSFVFGVVCGADLSRAIGENSIYAVCFLIIILIVIENDITKKSKTTVTE